MAEATELLACHVFDLAEGEGRRISIEVVRTRLASLAVGTRPGAARTGPPSVSHLRECDLAHGREVLAVGQDAQRGGGGVNGRQAGSLAVTDGSRRLSRSSHGRPCPLASPVQTDTVRAVTPDHADVPQYHVLPKDDAEAVVDIMRAAAGLPPRYGEPDDGGRLNP